MKKTAILLLTLSLTSLMGQKMDFNSQLKNQDVLSPQMIDTTPTLANGTYDATAAATSCLNAAYTSGIKCYFPPGIYNITSNIELLKGDNSHFHNTKVGGAGKMLDPTLPNLGTTIKCPVTVNCISANYTTFAEDTFSFDNITFLGTGTSSGNGLYICCGAISEESVYMDNVSFLNFKGSGKTGRYLDGILYGSFKDNWFFGNTVGFQFVNSNVVKLGNEICKFASQDCSIFTNSGQVEFNGGSYENNQKSGIQLAGVIGAKISNIHAEGNNLSHTANTCAITFNAVSSGFNENITIDNLDTNQSTDCINSISDGTASSVNIHINNAHMNPVSNPQIAIDSNSFGWSLTDSLNADCTNMTDAGSLNSMRLQNKVYNCSSVNAAVMDFMGPINTKTINFTTNEYINTFNNLFLLNDCGDGNGDVLCIIDQANGNTLFRLVPGTTTVGGTSRLTLTLANLVTSQDMNVGHDLNVVDKLLINGTPGVTKSGVVTGGGCSLTIAGGAIIGTPGC